MSNWVRRRKVSLVVHLVFALIPLSASTVAAFTWWSDVIGDPWAAAFLLTTLEILAISSLILYISRIQWPLAWVRHLIPFLSVVPLGYELYLILKPNGWLAAGLLSLVVTSWFVYLSYQLFRSMESLFIDPAEAIREKATQQMENLQVTLASWEAASSAVYRFADGVHQAAHTATRIIDVQPTMPLLQAGPSSNPKMRDIARLAQVRAADGTWALAPEVIQKETRAPLETVKVVVGLVRSGQIAFVEEASDGNS